MSRDRLPADGQAQSENTAGEEEEESTHAREQQESGEPSGRREQVEGAEQATEQRECLERGHLQAWKDTGAGQRRDLEPEQDAEQQGGSRDLEQTQESGNGRIAGRSGSGQDIEIIITRTGTGTETEPEQV